MMRTLVVKRLSKSKKTFRNYTVRSEHIKSKYIAENLLHKKEKKINSQTQVCFEIKSTKIEDMFNYLWFFIIFQFMFSKKLAMQTESLVCELCFPFHA